jgi:hypothetical protein
MDLIPTLVIPTSGEPAQMPPLQELLTLLMSTKCSLFILLSNAPEWLLIPIEDTNQTVIQQYQQDVGYPNSQPKQSVEGTLLLLRQEHSHLY